MYCELKDGFIIISDGPGKKPMGFMEIHYSRLKLSLEGSEKKIRLIKNKKYEELWSDEETILKKWFEGLAPYCIYSNFRADYEILGLLGKGNFAKVYLVEDRKTKAKYSAKIFDKDLVKKDPFELECFLYEVQMLRKVKGSYLLRTHRIYEGENNIYCLGEYYSGGTLYEHLKNLGRPTELHTITIMKQLLEALAYLEKLNLIHRDLKPENIMLVDKSASDLSIVDFGFMTKKTDYKKLFSRCGTPGYVAPEVLADQEYNCNADVFSAGIIFYVLLSK